MGPHSCRGKVIKQFSEIFKEARLPLWLKEVEVLATNGDGGIPDDEIESRFHDEMPVDWPRFMEPVFTEEDAEALGIIRLDKIGKRATDSEDVARITPQVKQDPIKEGIVSGGRHRPHQEDQHEATTGHTVHLRRVFEGRRHGEHQFVPRILNHGI